MTCGGIDIGSRFIKYAVIRGSDNISFAKVETGHDPLSACQRLLERERPEKLVATGYGRHLLEVQSDVRTITEIKAVAKGVKALFPGCRTIIDIGGQDTKVIRLDPDGRVENFEMNDRCAAGTGRFLEIMAKALGYDIGEFGAACGDGPNGIKINSLCTVFAESEVIGLISKGSDRRMIARAIHDSIVQKVIPLIQRVGSLDEIVFVGGCAMNACLRQMFEGRLRKRIYVSENPFIHAAYGAALYAQCEG